MTERAETRERHRAALQEAPEGIGGPSVGLRTPGFLGHTNAPYKYDDYFYYYYDYDYD